MIYRYISYKCLSLSRYFIFTSCALVHITSRSVLLPPAFNRCIETKHVTSLNHIIKLFMQYCNVNIKMVPNEDILIKLNTPEIIELKDFYNVHKDQFPQVYSFLKTTLKWHKTHPEYITVFSVQGDWRNDGTFIALLTFSCYDIFMHSLQDSYEKLRIGLTQTKQINWYDYEIIFYAMYEKLKPIILQALSDINVPIKLSDETYLWQLPQNAALQLSDTFDHNDYYMDAVKAEDAEAINAIWPPRFNTSLEYIRTFITMNGGFGIYEKSTHELVSWVLINVLGQLGVLQTREGYFKNGFGAALTRKAARIIGKNGDHPIGTIGSMNLASQGLFTKLGFEQKFYYL
ncbi:uncharacterized protein [Atheta coriaria]|uniref:uncharacterized protein isoform X2 n=1 Tax=Dalotia coriaria TaxID=877792 RepID=UPI0031F45748